MCDASLGDTCDAAETGVMPVFVTCVMCVPSVVVTCDVCVQADSEGDGSDRPVGGDAAAQQHALSRVGRHRRDGQARRRRHARWVTAVTHSSLRL